MCPVRRIRARGFLPTIVGSSMAFIDGTVVNVALPALQSGLPATVVDVQWVIESYGLFLSALILVGGALGDFLGRRKMFLLGVVGFAVVSAGCGFSSNIKSLLVWRSVQGIAAAFLVPGSLAIISSSFDVGSRFTHADVNAMDSHELTPFDGGTGPFGRCR